MFHAKWTKFLLLGSVSCACALSSLGGCSGGSNRVFKPNSNTPITINQISATISDAGGAVTFTGVGAAVFASGAFNPSQIVTITRQTSAAELKRFQDTTQIFGANDPLPYQVRINTGKAIPATATFDVVLNIPDSFASAVPAGSGVEAFLLVRAGDGSEVLDTWELVGSTLDSGQKTLKVTIPSFALSSFFTSNGTYEVTLSLASTPGSHQDGSVPFSTTATPPTPSAGCAAVSIDSPLASVEVQEGFGELRRDSAGFYKLHWGADLQAAVGTSVLAAGDGVIDFTGDIAGYGQTIVLRHTAGGVRTLYGHLSAISVKSGDTVTSGSEIGKSGISGNASAARPHLHFELAPNGSIFDKKNKVDPVGCLGNQAQGDITVNDNGNLADDAFEVYIDGNFIGKTDIGASNKLATGQLRLGDHELKVVCVVAPDNLGTYEISLAGKTVFKTGNSTYRTGTLGLNGSVTETIVVFAQNQTRTQAATGSRPNPHRER